MYCCCFLGDLVQHVVMTVSSGKWLATSSPLLVGFVLVMGMIGLTPVRVSMTKTSVVDMTRYAPLARSHATLSRSYATLSLSGMVWGFVELIGISELTVESPELLKIVCLISMMSMMVKTFFDNTAEKFKRIYNMCAIYPANMVAKQGCSKLVPARRVGQARVVQSRRYRLHKSCWQRLKAWGATAFRQRPRLTINSCWQCIIKLAKFCCSTSWFRVMILFLMIGCCDAGKPSVIDTRAIGKPRVFGGNTEDFKDWAFQFQAYVALLDPRYVQALLAAASSPTEVPLASDPDELVLQNTLCWIVVMLVSGSALSEVRAITDANGLEAWRRLVMRYEPRSRNRQLALLDSVLRPEFGASSADGLQDKLLRWEQEVRQYDATAASPLADEIKIATLLRGLGEVHRQALLQYLGGSTSSVTYQTVRDYLTNFLSSSRTWDPDAMDIGALQFDRKGKGKSRSKKDKGKGKGSKSSGNASSSNTGAGKGTPGKFTGTCNWCKKKGHKEVDCWSKQKGHPRGRVAAVGEQGGYDSAQGSNEQLQAQRVQGLQAIP